MGLQEKWLRGHSAEDLLHDSDGQAIPNVGTRDYPAGAFIFKNDEPSHEMYIILSGRVMVYQQREQGNDVILAELGPLELVGEMGCLQGVERSANAVALEDSRLMVIPESEVDETISSLPRWFVRLVDTLINRLRNTAQRIDRCEV